MNDLDKINSENILKFADDSKLRVTANKIDYYENRHETLHGDIRV